MTVLVQPRLPGTLPTPKDARRNLIDSKVALAQARAAVERFQEARKVAKEQLGEAEDDRADALANLEDSNEPTTTAAYVAAVEVVRDREVALQGAKLALKEARVVLGKALARRRSADEDMLAIAHGRRGGDA
jgi:hypothetical protein